MKKSRDAMQKLLTVQQAKEIDIRAREKYGISTLVLMENAGRAVAEEALKALGKKKSVAIFCGNTRPYRNGRCAIFCGKGNNGGDGLVAARHLLTAGAKPAIFLAGYIDEVKDEAKANLEILLRLGEKIVEVEEENLDLVKRQIQRYNLIIDALLGVGLFGEVRGIYRDLIGIINTTKANVLAVDIPSGLDATTGKILGCCVKAGKTVTFVAKKRGMVTREGRKLCGTIVVKDLGVPLVIGEN